MNEFDTIFRKAKEAAGYLANIDDLKRSEVLLTLADLIDSSHVTLLQANNKDLEKMDKTNPLFDRLLLTDARLRDIARDLRQVAALPSPVGEIIENRTLSNGIELQRIRVPFGVVGIIYEARPNVTFDVFALCMKSGNACVLKGGKDADESNKAIITLIHKALQICGMPEGCCSLLPSTHDATTALLRAVGWVDVCIPRGGRKLIDYVRKEAQVPVIETGAGVVHTYFDIDGDLTTGRKIIENGKTRRVSVCNALDTLLIHKDRLKDLPGLISNLARKGVEIYADEAAYAVLKDVYPAGLLKKALPEHKDREWMDLKMGIYVVDTVKDAIVHISKHGSGHSESIVTGNKETAAYFTHNVDAACVYVNLPTSFTDGGQFELGAEIGISTQKLGPRGPMGLKEITTYRYILTGCGQIRP